MMKPASIGLAAGLALGLSGGCLADDLMTSERFTETGVSFDLKGSYSNVTLTIVGPHDFHASASSRSGAPAIDLRRLGAVEDGTYTYQLTAATDERVKATTRLDDGRGPGATVAPRKGVTASGTFQVKGGMIVKRDTTAQPSKRDQN